MNLLISEVSKRSHFLDQKNSLISTNHSNNYERTNFQYLDSVFGKIRIYIPVKLKRCQADKQI